MAWVHSYSWNSANAMWDTQASKYLVRTDGGVLYFIYVDAAFDVVFLKSSDGGITWSAPSTIKATSAVALSIWYDRWSGISGDLIHCAYTDSGADDVFYRNINTASSDNLSTESTVFLGVSTALGGSLSIARARGGNLVCAYCIDAGAELGCARSTDVGATWGAIASPMEATTDQIIMLPGWAADTQDMMAFFWDASADEISRKLYDDSLDSWAETSIATSMADGLATTASPHFDAAVDIANSRNVLVAWSAVDTLNADLRCWTVTESAITEKTNIVLNSAGDQGLCALAIDTANSRWYVAYGGTSAAAQTFTSAIGLYYRYSDDAGATWSAEQTLKGATADIRALFSWMRAPGLPRFAYQQFMATNNSPQFVLLPREVPRARYVIGI